jgi:hypothetical protein
MDLLQRTDLTELAAERPGTPCVSLFMPTHRFGSGVQADRIRWKNLVDRVESELLASQIRRPDVESLLAPARELYEDTLDWESLSDGLAVFLRPEWHRVFRVPASLAEVGAVGERFVLAPLVRILSDNEHFLALSISQSQVGLWEGSRYHLDPVTLPDVPESLRDVVEPAEPRSDTMARAADRATRGGPAVFYGHGASDDQHKQNELVKFLRQVASGLSGYLADERLPMVLVGLEPMLATYRTVADYGPTLDDEVRRNPDGMSAEQLHEAVWPLVADHVSERTRQQEDAFAAAHGTGRASSDPEKVARAATEGRVDTLFLAGDPWCWEQAVNEASPLIRLGSDPGFAHCELLDRATIDTLSHRGTILVTPGPTAPGGGDVAALFRY